LAPETPEGKSRNHGHWVRLNPALVFLILIWTWDDIQNGRNGKGKVQWLIAIAFDFRLLHDSLGGYMTTV
jgi:hypothetical protein